MRASTNSTNGLTALSFFRTTLIAAAAAAALAACGGGGVTPTVSAGGSSSGGGGGGGTSMTATPYVLFSSNYVAYSAQTNGSFLHSVQGGNIYTGFGGKYAFGCYSSPQTDMDRTQFYNLQAQANGDGNCGATTSSTPPVTAADFVFVAIQAPGSSATTTNIPPLDIGQSSRLLIQMGNTVTPSASTGNVTVLTVDLNNANGSGAAATADCNFNQTLATVGPGTPSALGVLNYSIPLASFTCTSGSLTTLLSTGVTTVAVKILGDKNPNVKVGEFNTVAVGYVGFTK